MLKPLQNEPPAIIKAADSAEAGLQFEVKKDGDYILRLQPELLSAGEYTLTISTCLMAQKDLFWETR